MKASLLVRADGGPEIGSGHLARCFALAETWVRRGHPAVLMSDGPPAFWADRFRSAGVEVRDPGEQSAGFDWVVIDGYRLSAPVDDHKRVLRVDDFGRSSATPGSWVLDQNLGSAASLYPESVRQFLGPRYALIRRSIREVARAKALKDRGNRLLVSVGGAPSAEVQSLVESIVDDPALADVDVDVLDGTTDSVEAMRMADAAVTASGTTVWELLLVGVPMVLLVVADNQQEVAAALVDRGAALMGGAVHGVDPRAVAERAAAVLADEAIRRPLIAAGSELVDGRGSGRVISAMLADLIDVRPVTTHDVERVYRWNNEPATRQASLNQEPIPWADHESWFARRLADETSHMYVGSVDGSDLGLVRFEPGPGDAVVSVVIDPEYRGQGWASALIDAGCSRLRDESEVQSVTAQIRSSNHRSIEAFLAADFDHSGGHGRDTGASQAEVQEFRRWFR